MNKGIFAALVVLLIGSFGCENSTSSTQFDPIAAVNQCAILGDSAICTIESDPSIVARCEQGECVPFNCDICPRLPCQTTSCIDNVCHQSSMDNGTSCVAFPEPLSTTGTVGECQFGECVGLMDCETNADCPTVECVLTVCNDSGKCEGRSPLPGTSCEYAPGQLSWCFNYTCQTPINASIPRQVSPE